MENNTAFIVDCMKTDIEKKVGRTLLTPGDFKVLTLQINMECGEQISSHTLMRIWGYVKTTSKPSMHTLSLLSRFLGYKSLSHYVLNLNTKKSKGSAFIESEILVPARLDVGDTVTLKWHPARCVTLEYLGECIFRVVNNVNSRLNVGDEFQCVSFAKGVPFVARIIIGDSNESLSYIGGKEGGLTEISVTSKK